MRKQGVELTMPETLLLFIGVGIALFGPIAMIVLS